MRFIEKLKHLLSIGKTHRILSVKEVKQHPLFQKAKKSLLGRCQKTRGVSVVALSFAFIAFGAAATAPGSPPDKDNIAVRTVEEEVVLPSLSDQLEKLRGEKQFFAREDKIRPGDTLGTLLTRLGVDDQQAFQFIKSDEKAKAFLHLKTGRTIQAKTDDKGILYWLSAAAADPQEGITIVITRTDAGFTSSNEVAKTERMVEMRSGTIQSSLFAATDTAGIPDAVTKKMIEMFSTHIDFNSDLRRGDHFNVVYETFWQNGKLLKTGNILAAEFVNAGEAHQIIWFERLPGKGDYYDFNGKSNKKAFLRSPLEFTRVSSGFATRVHPVTGNIRQHKGIDFAAPTGTPIRAAADGTINFSGWQNGYGNFIVLKHWGAYSTAYGHMSRIAPGMSRGRKVSQGDIIGYVGSTGLSTGPHLHYEFRVDNVQQNPMKMDMPNAHPLTAREMVKFKANLADMQHRFSLMDSSSHQRQAASN